MIRIITNI